MNQVDNNNVAVTAQYLADKGYSITRAAQNVGCSPAHLTRVLQGDREQERVRPAEDVKSVLPPREDDSMDEQTFSPAGDLPEEVRGAFPKGACYNIGARAWLGMVPVARLHLSPDAPQVKVGSNKKGVVNPLVGDYRQDAPPVYVWQRRS